MNFCVVRTPGNIENLYVYTLVLDIQWTFMWHVLRGILKIFILLFSTSNALLCGPYSVEYRKSLYSRSRHLGNFYVIYTPWNIENFYTLVLDIQCTFVWSLLRGISKFFILSFLTSNELLCGMFSVEYRKSLSRCQHPMHFYVIHTPWNIENLYTLVLDIQWTFMWFILSGISNIFKLPFST